MKKRLKGFLRGYLISLYYIKVKSQVFLMVRIYLFCLSGKRFFLPIRLIPFKIRKILQFPLQFLFKIHLLLHLHPHQSLNNRKSQLCSDYHYSDQNPKCHKCQFLIFIPHFNCWYSMSYFHLKDYLVNSEFNVAKNYI